jgi:hypothetical protein
VLPFVDDIVVGRLTQAKIQRSPVQQFPLQGKIQEEEEELGGRRNAWAV